LNFRQGLQIEGYLNCRIYRLIKNFCKQGTFISGFHLIYLKRPNGDVVGGIDDTIFSNMRRVVRKSTLLFLSEAIRIRGPYAVFMAFLAVRTQDRYCGLIPPRNRCLCDDCHRKNALPIRAKYIVHRAVLVSTNWRMDCINSKLLPATAG
jgi:hypothetical protein